jgi:cell division protein FtsB
MNTKQKILRLFFMSEIVVVSSLYLFGSHGFYSYLKISRENGCLQQEIVILEKEIENLQDEQKMWHTHPTFYCEQYAREKLHMARKNEVIYYNS